LKVKIETGISEKRIMQDQGAGGVGFVSVGISEALIAIIVIIAVLFGVWKAAKLIWAALSN
jgi:hypothetical protein